jgi:prolyl-tRNA editing enzyme YbaK/EbsC (Cys-tRNA(Pro) deacylase)
MPDTTQLPASAQKVYNFLMGKGCDIEVIELNHSTRTAVEAAENVGCNVAQIAKSLIFKDKKTKMPVLVIASGANRVDTKKIEAYAGIRLGRADGNYVKEKVGFAIGGVPPFAHTTPLQTFLDPDLKEYATLWAAAGTPNTLFELQTDQLEILTGGKWVELAEEIK